jgi:UTP-glucose-1-phosphate uridylyltransferase
METKMDNLINFFSQAFKIMIFENRILYPINHYAIVMNNEGYGDVVLYLKDLIKDEVITGDFIIEEEEDLNDALQYIIEVIEKETNKQFIF